MDRFLLVSLIHSKTNIRSLICKGRVGLCIVTHLQLPLPLQLAILIIIKCKWLQKRQSVKCQKGCIWFLPPAPQHAKVLGCERCALTFLITIFFPWAVSLHRILEELLNPIKVYILQQTGWSNKGESAEMGLHPSIRSLLAANAGFTTGNVISWQKPRQKSGRVWCGFPSPLPASPSISPHHSWNEPILHAQGAKFKQAPLFIWCCVYILNSTCLATPIITPWAEVTSGALSVNRLLGRTPAHPAREMEILLY